MCLQFSHTFIKLKWIPQPRDNTDRITDHSLVLHRYTSTQMIVVGGERTMLRAFRSHFGHKFPVTLCNSFDHVLRIEAEVNGKCPNDLQPPSAHIFIDTAIPYRVVVWRNQWPTKSNKIQRNWTTATNRKMWFLFRSRLIALFRRLVRFDFFFFFLLLSFGNVYYPNGYTFHCLYDDKCYEYVWLTQTFFGSSSPSTLWNVFEWHFQIWFRLL